MKYKFVFWASNRAIVVLPTPGGPQNTIELNVFEANIVDNGAVEPKILR